MRTRVDAALRKLRVGLDVASEATEIPAHLADPARVFVWPGDAPVRADKSRKVRESFASLGTVVSVDDEQEPLPPNLRQAPGVDDSTRRPDNRQRARYVAIPRWAAAASVLLIAGFAAATVYLSTRPTIVAAGNSELVADLMSRFRFRDAGVPPEAHVSGRAAYLVPGKGKGWVYATTRPDGEKDICAFLPSGALAWTARQAWPEGDRGRILNRRAQLARVVWLIASEEPHEQVVVFAYRVGRQVCVAFADPLNGRLHGCFFYRGRIPRDALRAIEVLPQRARGSRRFVVCAQYGEGMTAEAAMLVVERTGRVIQQVHLGRVGALDRGAVYPHHAHPYWPGMWFTVNTTETTFFQFPIRDRQLDMEGVRVFLGDRFGETYEQKRGHGTWPEFRDRVGGLGGLRRKLRGQVRSVDQKGVSRDWFDG